MSAAGSAAAAPANGVAKPAATATTAVAAPAATAPKTTDADLAARAKASAAGREAQEQVKTLTAELDAAKARHGELEAQVKEWTDFQAQLSSKDKRLAATLRSKGLTFDEVATMFLTEGEENDLPPELREARSDLASIKERLAAEDKAKEQEKAAATAKEQADAVEALHKDVGAILDGAAGDFPYCTEYRDEVVSRSMQLVTEHLKANPITETDSRKQDEIAAGLFRTAFEQLEAQLSAEAEKEHERLSRLVAPKPALNYSRGSKLTVIERQTPPAQKPGTKTIGSSVRGSLPVNTPKISMSGGPRRLGIPVNPRTGRE